MSWLFVSARFPRRDSGVDVERYGRSAVGLVNYINDAVDRGFAGSRWLRQRFVNIALYPHAGETVSAGKLRTKNYGGATEIICSVSVPASWFSVPGDGLLAIRLFQAVLRTLYGIGDHYGLGPPPLRSKKADPGRPDLMDPFSPPKARPAAYDVAASAFQEIADRIDPHQMVLAAWRPGLRREREQQEAVVHALGAVEAEHVLPVADQGEIRAWVIRQDS